SSRRLFCRSSGWGCSRRKPHWAGSSRSPGNVRGRPGRFSVLDWGDAVIGNPILDRLRFCDWLSDVDRPTVELAWLHRWQEAVSGCEPDRAATLLRPVAPLLGAVTYQRFLDLIEPDEHPYHAPDPLACLLAADRLARRER